MSLNDLPINFFDVFLVVVLGLGIYAGRKHGMSEELLGLVKWVTIVLVCGMFYEPLGQLIAQSTPFSLLSSYILVYLTLGLAIFGLFALLKNSLGGKLLGSDIFGQAEYYLGMGSGLIRFACVLLAVLALLNARYYPPAEVRAMEKFQEDVYGTNFFPTLHTVQQTVFDRSYSGRFIKDNLGFLLIKPTMPENKTLERKQLAMP